MQRLVPTLAALAGLAGLAACAVTPPAAVVQLDLDLAKPPAPTAAVATSAPTASVTAPPSGAAGALVGLPAPEITAEPAGGNGPTTLQGAKGKVVVVHFWATFCEPCKRSFPGYQALADAHHGDVVVLAVSVDDPDIGKGELAGFARALGTRFPLVWDKDHATAHRYRLRSMPATFVVDREGVVRHVHEGFRDTDLDSLAEEVKALTR